MKPTVLVDTRQKAGYHPEVEDIRSMGYDILRIPLAVGDYAVCSEEVIRLKELKEKEQIYFKEQKNKEKQISWQGIDSLGTYRMGVDTKADMIELYGNLVGADRYRFEAELTRAWNLKMMLLILITAPEYQSEKALKEYVYEYTNRQGITNRNENAGRLMVSAMRRLSEIYPVMFQFCDADDAAKEIINFIKTDFPSFFV